MQHQENGPTMKKGEEATYFSSRAPPLGDEFEKDMGENEDYEKARDTSLPLSERGDALTRICSFVSRGKQKIDAKISLGIVFQHFNELGSPQAASILTDILFDASPEVSGLVMTNIGIFVARTNDKDFEAIIYSVAEDLDLHGEKHEAVHLAAKHLMKYYFSQFIPAIFAPGSIAKGSLKWLTGNYRALKLELFSNNSEAGANVDQTLMTALKSSSSHLIDTIDKTMISMDALTTVVKSIQSVLGIYSDLLRTSGESEIVIASTALTSFPGTQPKTPRKGAFVSSTTRHRGRDSACSQLSPTKLTPTAHHSYESGSSSRQHSNNTSRDGTLSARERGTSSAAGASTSTSTPDPEGHTRSSSAPPTPTTSKRTCGNSITNEEESLPPKRPKKDDHSPATPSPPRQSSQAGANALLRGSSSGGRGYQGKNFIPGYRGSFRGRHESFRSSSWRGRQYWNINGSRSDHGYSRGGSDYPPRMNYD